VKYILILLSFFVIGCSSNQSNLDQKKAILDSIRISDSTKVELYTDLTSKIIKLKVDFEESGDPLLNQIDSLQKFVIKYQGDAIKLQKAKTELIKFTEVNKEIILKMADLKNQNDELRITNDSIKIAFVKESESAKKFKKMNRLIPVLFTVKGYYHSKKLFGKSKLVESSESKLIEYIEISFTFAASEVVSQKEYTVITTLYDKTGNIGISKPIIFPYSGEEKSYSVIFNNDTLKFDKGNHKVSVKVDSKIYDKSILLK